MAYNRLVGVDEALNLPPEVQAQLSSNLENTFNTQVTQAVNAAGNAQVSAEQAESVADFLQGIGDIVEVNLTGASGYGTLSAPGLFVLLSVQASASCRFRLYATESGRALDSSRDRGEPYLWDATLVRDVYFRIPDIDLERPTLGSPAPGSGGTMFWNVTEGTANLTVRMVRLSREV